MPLEPQHLICLVNSLLYAAHLHFIDDFITINCIRSVYKVYNVHIQLKFSLKYMLNAWNRSQMRFVFEWEIMQNKLHIIIGVLGTARFGAYAAHETVKHTSRIERYQPEKVEKLSGMHKLPKKITTQLLLTQVCV